MYRGENQTALRSQKWLDSALLELLKEEKYAKITVKDICRKADLSRQTFYQMFSSKDEVMEYHFFAMFEEFKADCGNFDGITCEDLAGQFFRLFYDERDFVSILIDNNMTYLLERQFEQYLPQISLFRRINKTEQYPDYSVAYVAGALTQLLIHWFKNNFEPSVSEVGGLTKNIINGTVYLTAMGISEEDNTIK